MESRRARATRRATRCSGRLEALLRRAASGLPRVNRLTDLYNAVSVLHQLPLGGEELSPMTDGALHAAADDLAAQLARLGPGVRVGRRLICRAG